MESTDNKHITNKNWIMRAMVIALCDALIIAVSFLVGFLLRFDFEFPTILEQYQTAYITIVPVAALITIVVFFAFKLYHSIWRFASVNELERLLGAWLLLTFLSVVFVIIDFKVTGFRHIPISVWMMGLVFSAIGTTALRFGFRFIRFISKTSIRVGKNLINVMIIGAGECGKDVIHEYTMSKHLNAKVCCLIDDNPIKRGRTLDGVPIVGNRNDIPKMVGKYEIDEIVFAIHLLFLMLGVLIRRIYLISAPPLVVR